MRPFFGPENHTFATNYNRTFGTIQENIFSIINTSYSMGQCPPENTSGCQGCSPDFCVSSLPISSCYSISTSAIGCENSWFNGLTVKVNGFGEHVPNTTKVFSGSFISPNGDLWSPWKTATGGGASLNFYLSATLTAWDYLDEQGEPKRQIGSEGVYFTIAVSSAGGQTSYYPITMGGGCAPSETYLYTTVCEDMTNYIPPHPLCIEYCLSQEGATEQSCASQCQGTSYTIFGCNQVQSTTPITVPTLHGVVDYYYANGISLPGINSIFINRFSGCSDCCYYDASNSQECLNDGSCKTGYLVSFSIAPTTCE